MPMGRSLPKEEPKKWKRNLVLIGVCYLISVLVGIAVNAVFPAAAV